MLLYCVFYGNCEIFVIWSVYFVESVVPRVVKINLNDAR